MFALAVNSFVFTILTICMVEPCNSNCKTVSSNKYGTLFLSRSEKPKSSCISNFIFQSKETGKSFCLLKKRRKMEKLTCTGCFCGQENKPQFGTEVGVVGGSMVEKDQYPWYAMILRKDGKDSYRGIGCGGSLISDKVVLSAAHCVINPLWEYFIGLGLHNISGNYQWSEKELKKYVVIKVKEVIKHEEWSRRTINYDFSLFILKDPARLSRAVSPVCLPNINEVDILERKENILIGFGSTKVWFLEYKKLLGGKLESASLIPPEISANKSTILAALTNDEFHENVVHGYFKTLVELFPGIGICIRKYEFVCNITKNTLDIIIRNIEQKIRKSGNINDNQDIAEFLDKTHSHILLRYQHNIDTWISYYDTFSDDDKYKSIISNFDFWVIPGFDKDAENRIKKFMVKYVNQWYFIGATLNIAVSHFSFPDILKKATGKFVPWSEATKWNHVDPTITSREHPSKILCERFQMKDGYNCPGDSGGPIFVESNGRFSVVAVVSTVPGHQYLWSWPPPCFCSCEILPEVQARVSHVLPWIYQNLEQRELNVPCKA